MIIKSTCPICDTKQYWADSPEVTPNIETYLAEKLCENCKILLRQLLGFPATPLPTVTTEEKEKYLTPTEKIRAQYTKQQETGQPPIQRPISVGETMVMPTAENPHPEIPPQKQNPDDTKR